MCGIAGTVGANNKIKEITYHQHSRGKDSTGYYSKGRLDIGHNRLSILDLSENGNQPMESERYVLSYNGEIYNYKELSTPASGNDAKTLLAHVERVGLAQALKDINGMYGFALYDKQEDKLHLVVDRMGQKPVFYYQHGEEFAFASSVGGLLHLRDHWKISREGMATYWTLGATYGEHTMIEGIKRLRGSQHLCYDVNKNSFTIERYWSPEFQENTSGIEELVLDAINKVKIADVKIYLFLSGGVDSTLICSQLRKASAIHLGNKEWEYAKRVANTFGVELIGVDPDDSQIEESLLDYAYKTGEPAMAALIPYVTSKEVSKYGKVAISANGADELFYGYKRTRHAISYKQVHHIFRGHTSPRSRVDLLPIDPRLSQGRWLELQTYVEGDLNKTLDAASMCHSLEVRNPFLDHRLVEMALSMSEQSQRTATYPGGKATLKEMLRKMGFEMAFLNRPKLGFSLHKEPEGINVLKEKSWKFVTENNFLVADRASLSGRDQQYLSMAALSFYYWVQKWKDKIAP